MRVTPACDSINSFSISSAEGIQTDPDVTSDGTDYMVVWSDLRVDGNSTVYAARVTQEGVVLDPAGIQVGPADGTLQKEPSIEFIGDKYFVVWGHLAAPFGVTGRFVSLDGSLGDTIHIANSSAEVHNTAIAYDGNKMFVVWTEYPGLLRGQLVSTTGALIGSPFTIADEVLVVNSGNICFSGSEYFVIYNRMVGFILELWGRKYDASGNPMHSPFWITSPTQSSADGYVVAGDEYYLCVWSKLLYRADIYGNLDFNVGVESNGSNVIVQKTPYTTVIISGPLLLPDDKKCVVVDITGRVVAPDKILPGIYFVMSDNRVVQKVIKAR
ncbi:MAG: hypothetical protein JSV97_04720 [candidate division WOR-3 bacterium]|nr:MAG: hypothetical protein JSV97_04720 [candidate division WOR-3 bacterium]